MIKREDCSWIKPWIALEAIEPGHLAPGVGGEPFVLLEHCERQVNDVTCFGHISPRACNERGVPSEQTQWDQGSSHTQWFVVNCKLAHALQAEPYYDGNDQAQNYENSHPGAGNLKFGSSWLLPV